jgi:hypothetical protein
MHKLVNFLMRVSFFDIGFLEDENTMLGRIIQWRDVTNEQNGDFGLHFVILMWNIFPETAGGLGMTDILYPRVRSGQVEGHRI